MRYLYVLSTFLLLLNSSYLSGQWISGKITDAQTGEPVPDAIISVRDLEGTVVSGSEGAFSIFGVPAGRWSYSVEASGFEKYFSNFQIASGDSLDLGNIRIYNLTPLHEKDISYLSETDISLSEEATEVVSLLTASQDEFNRTASFDFGVARFRTRGYHPNFAQVYLNGMPMNDLEDGYAAWSIWGGLNDVTRRQQSNNSLEPSFFSFGGLGGSTNISTLASDQYKQIRASFSLTNRTYRQRAMLTWSTGMLKSGWAFSFSGSRRWSDEGYIYATFYDAYSYFASIDKKVGNSHLFNLTFLNAPNQRGKNSGATQEIYDLLGTNYYNSYWGYQEGEKRNSRISRSYQPLATLRHVWTPNSRFTLNTSVGFQGGRYGNTRLDWYNAADPRPDYYRYLPSYKESENDAENLYQLLAANPEMLQIDWNRLYEVNLMSHETIRNVDGIEGNDVSGRMSQYVVEEQREDPLKLAFNTYFQSDISESFVLNGGLSYQYEQVTQFRKLDDLLGGEFYIDFDKYAERDFPDNLQALQNNLERPNRLIYEGDTFGYHFDLVTSEAKTWAKALFILDKIDFYLSGEAAFTSFYRNGHYKNGKFPESSFGKGSVQEFFTYGGKAGATYKLDGRNYIYVNGLYMTRAPYARAAYISPRTRHDVVEGLVPEKILSGEIAYELKAPRLGIRALGYYTRIDDQTEVRSFYHDDEASFVNYILTGIDQLHMGTELSVLYKLTPALSVKAVAAYGDYVYTSRPQATIAQDNNAEVLAGRTVYMKNFRIDGTPQKAYSLALSYNSPKYWFVNLSVNYFDDIYLDFNPERRTAEAVEGLDKEENPDLWYSIIEQEKLAPGYIVNFFGGKSWKIRDYYLYLQLGVNNVLNNTDFITGGYEQLRFDFDARDANTFPSRYFYAFGTNYFLNLSLRL